MQRAKLIWKNFSYCLIWIWSRIKPFKPLNQHQTHQPLLEPIYWIFSLDLGPFFEFTWFQESKRRENKSFGQINGKRGGATVSDRGAKKGDTKSMGQRGRAWHLRPAHSPSVLEPLRATLCPCHSLADVQSLFPLFPQQSVISRRLSLQTISHIFPQSGHLFSQFFKILCPIWQSSPSLFFIFFSENWNHFPIFIDWLVEIVTLKFTNYLHWRYRFFFFLIHFLLQTIRET